jgi:hypothetical protein
MPVPKLLSWRQLLFLGLSLGNILEFFRRKIKSYLYSILEGHYSVFDYTGYFWTKLVYPKSLPVTKYYLAFIF